MPTKKGGGEEQQEFDERNGRYAGDAHAPQAVSVRSPESYHPKSAEAFTNALVEAKKTVPERAAWRVASPTAEEFLQYHRNPKMYVTKGGGTVAITEDGDIVGLCKCYGDGLSGTDLLAFAVAKGGKKLDAFSGLFDFYSKRGFEPVSWTHFDERYAPPDWVKGRDAPEPIIFWKYTGKQTSVTCEQFLSEVSPSKDYGEAEKIRDEGIKK